MSYTEHISNYSDLVTSYNETRAGFILIALEKNRRANPYIEEARILQNRVKNCQTPEGLWEITDIHKGLIAASGISEKAAGHLGSEGCKLAIEGLFVIF